jgi:hypothetical protein
MNQLPATPNPGSPPAPAVWFRQAVDYLRALTGRVAALEARIGGGITRAGTVAFRPWALAGFIDPSGPTAKIRVAAGLVNNFVPTIGGTSLAAVPAPTITVTGASGVIYMRATVDGAGAITELIIANAVSIPADTSTAPIYKHKLIGTWTASGGVFTSVTSILNTNQTFRMCGTNAEWY